VQHAGEQDDEQNAQPEDGHGDAHQRQDGRDTVDRGVLVGRGQHAKRDTGDRRNHNGNQGKLNGCREAGHELLQHGGVRVIALAQITANGTKKKIEILDDDGVVKALGITPCLHRLGSCMLAQHNGCGVGGEHSHDEEDNDRNAQEHGNGLQDALENIFQHRGPSFL